MSRRHAWALTHSLKPDERLIVGTTWAECSKLIRELFKYVTAEGKGYPPVKWVRVERVVIE